MSRAESTEESFANIVDALGNEPGVTRPDPPGAGAHRFGGSGLRVDGRIFAMVSRGQLVLKLPAKRVTELTGSGRGWGYDAGKGRPMKEWVSLDPETPEDCLDLALEALAFGRSNG